MDKYDPFDLFNNKWALVTAGTLNNFNCCTVSWGSLGILWRKKIVTIYVYPSRYTSNFLLNNEYFTISVFDEEYKKDLTILGSKSGRDLDKVALTSLTPISLKESVIYKEVKQVFYCKKIYFGQFNRDNVAEEIKRNYINNPNSFPKDENGEWRTHYMFVGEIIEEK